MICLSKTPLPGTYEPRGKFLDPSRIGKSVFLDANPTLRAKVC